MLRHREVKDLLQILRLINGRAEIQTQKGLASKLVGVEVGSFLMTSSINLNWLTL